MEAMAGKLAVSKLALSANDIANEVLRETRPANQGNLFQALNVEQLKAHVRTLPQLMSVFFFNSTSM